MANTRSGNTFYIDTQYAVSGDELAITGIKVTHVTLTATAANSVIRLDDSSLFRKIDCRVATSGDSKIFDFSDNPLMFTASIRPTVLTNGVASLQIQESRG